MRPEWEIDPLGGHPDLFDRDLAHGASVQVRGDGDDLRYRGWCACGWTGDAVEAENQAVEDAHDHAWPGWRWIPPAPAEPPRDSRSSAWARWDRDCHRLARQHYPDEWFTDSTRARVKDGAPIVRICTPPATRHAPLLSPFAGYSLARTPEAEAARIVAGGGG